MSKVKMHLSEYYEHDDVNLHDKILRKKIWSFVWAKKDKSELGSMLFEAINNLPSQLKVEVVFAGQKFMMPNSYYFTVDMRLKKTVFDAGIKEWANNVYNQFLYEYSKINS